MWDLLKHALETIFQEQKTANKKCESFKNTLLFFGCMDEQKQQKISFKEFYDKKYKALLAIPVLLIILSLIQIGYQIKTTGDFINKDVTLKGGITITIPTNKKINIRALEDVLSKDFLYNDVVVRSLIRSGRSAGIIISTDIDITNKKMVNKFISEIGRHIRMDLKEGDYSIEGIGSSLGASFFRETFRAIIIAFVFMGIVVFIYFRNPIPSLAVIAAAASDMIITLSIVNVMGMRLGTAGIAAFLMLIGYSVDTDILLTTRVLKRREGVLIERILGAMKTGLTMTATTIVAVSVAMIVTDSEVIRQIMTIILIGLTVDIMTTWILNVGILRMYLERKHEP